MEGDHSVTIEVGRGQETGRVGEKKEKKCCPCIAKS